MAEQMAELNNNPKKNIVYNVVATAQANQTYAQQINILKPYFTALSDDEKKRTLVYWGNAILNCANYALGQYTRIVAVQATDIQVVDFNAVKHYRGGADTTNTTDTEILKLVIMDIE